MKHPDDLSQLSMMELFRVETENQTALLTAGLLELERPPGEMARPAASGRQPGLVSQGQPASPQQLEALMRAAHSLKGAARIVGLSHAVRVAHAMEDCFVAAQRGQLRLGQPEIDALLRGVDLLQNLGRRTDSDREGWVQAHANEFEKFADQLRGLTGKAAAVEKPESSADGSAKLASATHPDQSAGISAPPARDRVSSEHETAIEPVPPPATDLLPAAPPPDEPLLSAQPERVLRLTAENLNRLLGLAGESLVESRWLRPFAGNMQRLKRHHAEVEAGFTQLAAALDEQPLAGRAARQMQELAAHLKEFRGFLDERLDELEMFDRRSAQLSHRLYLEVLRTRMRPFNDGARRFPRMVRDLARGLGKEVRLEIIGENTQVDRDILEKLETPLAHLLRNAVDHGCETPSTRQQQGKPPAATLRLEARHSAGQLLVIVADDGAGVNLESVRAAVVRKRLAAPDLAQRMSEAELLEFLFLPGFTLKEDVTELSGRGVGLDIVQNMVKSVRGNLRVSSQPGRGTRFQLQLPLTLSVLRALLLEIGGEPYAIPLGQINRTLRLPRADIETLEGHPHFRLHNEAVGLVAAHEVFGGRAPDAATDPLPVVVLGKPHFGLVVDRFLGERELVVQPLDARLGKVKDISAVATMEDGTPVLILDTDDVSRSVGKLLSQAGPMRLGQGMLATVQRRRKRVLAVDDSLTVRELERKLLLSRGYAAEVAVDGMDGWNAVRAGEFDLVITDVDMPRLDGIELTRLIRRDPRLESLPVMIVSYKDRDEDRLRGLEAGADYYLTKSGFHDEKLLQAVTDLIGEAVE